ncbi:MAG: putative quinol monooxygenase [Rikenellaceae bacterium]
MSELKIIATIVVKEEFKEELFPAFEAVVEGTRKEEGNVSYQLHQDVKNPLKYIFVEVWASLAAIDSHNASAHFDAFAKAIAGKVDNVDITIVRQVI